MDHDYIKLLIRLMDDAEIEMRPNSYQVYVAILNDYVVSFSKNKEH